MTRGMSGTSFRPEVRRDKPECTTLARLRTHLHDYKLLQFRWTATKLLPQTYLVCYAQRGKVSVAMPLCQFEGVARARWALKALKFVQARHPGGRFHPDERFWRVFSATVRTFTTDYSFLNMEIKRCRG